MMINNPPFKVCTMCSETWATREEFIVDPNLELNGYAADFEKLEYGLFYFTHNLEKCRTTFALQAQDFLDLYTGKSFKDRRTGSEECPGYCLDKEKLGSCSVQCECAFVREIIQIVKSKSV